MPQQRRIYGQALAGMLICLAFFYVCYHSLAGGTLLGQNAYDSYALQAQNWLAGRNDIAQGEQYPWLELAVYQGRYYLSFPPVPSVLALPWLLVLGWHPANLVVALWGLLTGAGVFACFWQRGAAPQACAFHAVFTVLGSNFCWLSTSGGVWMQAQVAALALCVWAVWAFLRGRFSVCSFLLALAVGCRPFSLLYLALLGLFLLGRCRALRSVRPLAGPVAAALAVGACLAAYNWARFGSPLEFGHTYLPEFMREELGQFHPAYFWPNVKNLLRPVTLDASLRLQFPLFNGFLPLAADPYFLLWAFSLAGAARRRQGRRLGLTLLGGALLTVCALCMHRTLGGWQFGARYLVDALPWAILWFVLRPQKAPGVWAYTLCGLAVLFNLYGAVYMLTA